MKKIHAKHGRDHGPNGFDPIPGSTSPVYMPGARSWNALSLVGSHVSNSGGTTVIDATVPNNMYLSHDFDALDVGTAFLFVPVFLGKMDGIYGPIGATGIDPLYYCNQVVRVGPDCPEYSLEIASAEVGGEVLGVFNGGLTWVNIFSDDLYAAADDWGDPWTADTEAFRNWYMYVTGNVGDVASSHNIGTGAIDGGPGLYYLRWVLDGKNASSSDYVFDIAHLSVSFSPV